MNQVRPFSEVHEELMRDNPDYRASWLAEHSRGDNLGALHHPGMKNRDYYDAFESKTDERKLCLANHIREWRELSGEHITVIAERMGVSVTTAKRVESTPLSASINSLARYAHACGLKISLEVI